MDYPIKDVAEITAKALGIQLNSENAFDVVIKNYTHTLTEKDLLTEMKDQLDVKNSVRTALLRIAQKEILSGIKRGRLRMDEDAREVFDLNILIWFADKTLKGEHQSYLTK